MPKKLIIYKNYIFSCFLVLIFCGLFIYYFLWTDHDDYSVEMLSPKEKISQSLFKDCKIQVKGVTGTVFVEIIRHKVHIIQSNCPDKICIKTGFISKPGQVIICSPNQVIVRIFRKKPKKDPAALVTY